MSFSKGDFNVYGNKHIEAPYFGINVEIIKHRKAFRPSNIKDAHNKIIKLTPPKKQQHIELPFLKISNQRPQPAAIKTYSSSIDLEEENPSVEVQQISDNPLAQRADAIQIMAENSSWKYVQPSAYNFESKTIQDTKQKPVATSFLKNRHQKNIEGRYKVKKQEVESETPSVLRAINSLGSLFPQEQLLNSQPDLTRMVGIRQNQFSNELLNSPSQGAIKQKKESKKHNFNKSLPSQQTLSVVSLGNNDINCVSQARLHLKTELPAFSTIQQTSVRLSPPQHEHQHVQFAKLPDYKLLQTKIMNPPDFLRQQQEDRQQKRKDGQSKSFFQVNRKRNEITLGSKNLEPLEQSPTLIVHLKEQLRVLNKQSVKPESAFPKKNSIQLPNPNLKQKVTTKYWQPLNRFGINRPSMSLCQTFF